MFDVISGEIYDENGERHRTFGVRARELVVEDVSLDRDAVDALVEQFNEQNLAPEHLVSVLEDYLLRNYIP